MIRVSYRLAFAASVTMLLAGCIDSGAYVETGYKTAGFGDIRPVEPPRQIHLVVESQRNGKPYKPFQAGLEYIVTSVLQQSGAYEVVSDGPNIPTLKVTADDEFSHGKAVRQGVGVGASIFFGGATTVDDYNFTFKLTDPAGADRLGNNYPGRILSNIGRKAPPTAARAESDNDAVTIVVQNAVLSFLYDVQQASAVKTPLLFMPHQPGSGGSKP